MKRAGPYLGLLLVLIFFGIAVRIVTGRNSFATADNLTTLAVQSTLVGTTALGMTLVILAGGIDLSVGAILALASMAVAAVLRAGGGGWTAAFAGVAAGALCGLFNGALIVGLRLMPFIATLGTMLMFRGVAKAVGDNRTIAPGPGPLDGLLTSRGGPGLWLLLALAAGMALLIRYTRFGRHATAVGSNEAAARLCGVRVGRVKLGVYALAGAFAGLAGLLQFSRLSIGDPTAAPGHELDVVAAVVIGGASLSGGESSVLGSLAGALLMTAIRNGCSLIGLESYVTEIVAGAIIVAAAALDRFRRSGPAVPAP